MIPALKPNIPFALLGIFAFMLLVPLLNNTNLMNGIQSAKTFGFLYGIMVLALVVSIQKTFSHNTTSNGMSLIDILVTIYVLWVSFNKFFLQSTISFSLNYYELLALLVLYFCTRCIKREHSLYLLTAICVAGLIQAVYGNLQLWGYYPSHHGMFKMTGSFFNPGPYAGFLCAVLPVAVGLYWKFNHKEININHKEHEEHEGFDEANKLNKWSNGYIVSRMRNYNFVTINSVITKYVSLITIVAIMLVLPAARSRASWLGAIIGVVYLAWHKYNVNSLFRSYINVKKKSLQGDIGLNMHIMVRKLVLVTLPIIILLAVSIGLYRFKKDSADGRVLIWTVTANIIKDNLLVGVGHDRFPAHYMDYQADYFRNNPGSKFESVADDNRYAFNEVLLTWAENGLIGLMLAGGLVLAVFFTPYYNHKGELINHEEHEKNIDHKDHKDHEEHKEFHEGNINGKLKVGAVKSETILKSAILSVLVFGMFAYPSEILPIKIVATICLALFAGMAIPLLKGKEKTFVPFVKKSSYPLRSLWFKLNLWFKSSLLIATVFAIILLLPRLNKLQQAYATWNDAYQLYNYNLYTDCLDEYEKGLPLLQHNGDFMLNYGKALSIAEKHPEALEILSRAKAFLSNTVLYTAMGDSHKALEQYQAAEQHYLQAANMAPGKFYPLYLLAKLYDASGQQHKAIATANTILNKKIKVHSTAIEEIKSEMKTILKQ